MSHEYVAIVGSRGFAPLWRVRAYVNNLARGVVVISGGAPGVDREAERAARERRMLVLVVRPADPSNRRSYAVRNQKIVRVADRVVAFWDGVSRGTAMVIAMARRAGKPCEVIR